MRLSSAELRKLALPLILATLALGAGAALIWYSEQQVLRANSAVLAARTERNQSREKLARISEEEREVREKIEIYRRLAETRVLGAERRLEWIDSIQRIRTSRELLDLRYRIEPQRLLHSAPGKSGNVDLNSSSMKVELALLHEGDLLAFLADLREAGNAYVSVRRCSLSRTGTGAAAQPGTTLAPRLRADCLIDLITIMDRGAKL
ncbi:MAG: hypothetical protein IPK29_02245 [Betaproteobacteria bacterium]|jgi:hypothetical protein|nr:hypothetical protein [Betaproteobacteria bacterium]